MMKRMVSLVVALGLVLAASAALAAAPLTCWFPPGWKARAPEAKAIVQALSEETGEPIRPRIAKSYPEILEAFDSGRPQLVYVGSFVQAVIKARGLGTPLAQVVNGKEHYSGILIYPEGADPRQILKQHPAQISFAVGASSGESSAKAATAGKAAVAVPNHAAAVGAVQAGKAKAAVVKNWWWQSNQSRYPGYASYEIPGISVQKNPDNVLTASKAVSAEMRQKLTEAAMKRKEAFKAREMRPVDPDSLNFSLSLMKQGQIDPFTYTW